MNIKNETYAITKAQLGKLWTKNTQENIDIIASLPVLTVEPFCHVDMQNWPPIRWDGKLRCDIAPFDGQPLYTSPQPLQPITAEMVTSEMVTAYHKAHNGDYRKDIIVNAVNVYSALKNKPKGTQDE